MVTGFEPEIGRRAEFLYEEVGEVIRVCLERKSNKQKYSAQVQLAVQQLSMYCNVMGYMYMALSL